MICLNFYIFRDLCVKHNLEPGDVVRNYSTHTDIVNSSSAIWGKTIEGSFKKLLHSALCMVLRLMHLLRLQTKIGIGFGVFGCFLMMKLKKDFL